MNSSFVTYKQYDPGQVTIPLQDFDVIMELQWDSARRDRDWGFSRRFLKVAFVAEVKVGRCEP